MGLENDLKLMTADGTDTSQKIQTYASQDSVSTRSEISKPTFIEMTIKEAKTEIYLMGGLVSLIAVYVIYQGGKKVIKDFKEYLFPST